MTAPSPQSQPNQEPARLSDCAQELLHSLADTAEGVRYQACDGKSRRAAAHELEQAGLVEWKGSSFGSQFYCITGAGLAVLSRILGAARSEQERGA